MKKQHLLKQVCGLCIGVAGTLVPLSSVQAADELSDRYINGYLNDPYTNETAPDTKSVLPRGAEGPIRADATASDSKPMAQKHERFEPVSEAYDPWIQGRGAQGPLRTDTPQSDAKPMTKTKEHFEPVSEAYNPPVQSLDEAAPIQTDTSTRGAQGPIRTDASTADDRAMKLTPQRFEPVSEAYNPPVQSLGAQGPIRGESGAVAEETKWP